MIMIGLYVLFWFIGLIKPTRMSCLTWYRQTLDRNIKILARYSVQHAWVDISLLIVDVFLSACSKMHLIFQNMMTIAFRFTKRCFDPILGFSRIMIILAIIENDWNLSNTSIWLIENWNFWSWLKEPWAWMIIFSPYTIPPRFEV